MKLNKCKIIKIVLSVFVACLLISHVPFWIGKKWLLFPTPLLPDGVLGFLIECISAVGTILLGWYAINQTNEANKTSNRLLSLEEKRYIEEHQPALIVESVILHNTTFNNTPLHGERNSRLYFIKANYENHINEDRASIELNIVNTGRTGIFNCQLIDISSTPSELSSGVENIDTSWASPFSLVSGNTKTIHLYTYPNVIERFARKELQKITVSFECLNNYNEKYSVNLTIEGDIILNGNRYEEMLIPTPHPIKWSLEIKQIS